MSTVSEASALHFASDSDQDDFEAAQDIKVEATSGNGARTKGPKKWVRSSCFLRSTPIRASTQVRSLCRLQVGEGALDIIVGSYLMVDSKTQVRCEPVPGERKCRRCQTKNLPCRARERKKRKAADTHEELQEKAHNQDLQIQQLLTQYDRLRADNKIRQWISNSHPQAPLHGYGGYASAQEMPVRVDESEDSRIECFKWLQGGTSPEDAAAIFFNLPNWTYVPDIVKHCSLYPEEIVELFSLFFKHVNSHFSILDEALHTPRYLINTSPFLFTVVCAISSRHYVSRPGVYPLAMDFARDAAGKGLVEGRQNVDSCQAYLLLAVYPVPKRKWVEDKSWLLMGVAIRMAMELKLNQPPAEDLPEHGSHAIQFGKMPMLRLDDFLARSSTYWYRSSRMNLPLDVHLCAYVQLLTIMVKWRMETAEMAKMESTKDSVKVAHALETHQLLSDEMDRWVKVYAEELAHNPLPVCSYRGNTTQLIAAYLKLVVLSNAFTPAYKQGLSPDTPFFRLSLNAARNVIQIMVERLSPTGSLRYAMDANFLYVSYAASYLIQLIRPKFVSLLKDTELKEIILSVISLIQVLGSRDVALDGRHTPALYSRFIAALLKQYCPKAYHPMVQKALDPGPGNGSPGDGDAHGPRSDIYSPSWPDVSSAVGSSSAHEHVNIMPGMIYQRHGDPEMDFSLNHFVRTVSQGMTPQVGELRDARPTSASSGAWSDWNRGDGMHYLNFALVSASYYPLSLEIGMVNRGGATCKSPNSKQRVAITMIQRTSEALLVQSHMDRFRPLRSSPPCKPSKLPAELSLSEVSSVEEPLADELRDLAQVDIELLDTVVQRAGPSANTFLTVFKAYSEVLTERGLDPHEVVYYSKLLKLGTMKGKNWGEKWARVKSQWERGQRSKPPLHPTGPNNYGPAASFGDESGTEFNTFSFQAAPRVARAAITTLDDDTPKGLGRRHEKPAYPLPTKERLHFPQRHMPSRPAIRMRVASPVSKRKEEMARDIIARAKQRKGTASINDTEAWKNIQMQHDEKNADLFRQDKLVERCWQIWRQGYTWILTTTEQVGEARDRLILQRSLEKWMRKQASHRQLYQHINELCNRRILLTFLRLWQDRAQEARHKRWRQDMRNKMRTIRHNHETRLIKDAWCRWRAATQAKLVYQSYLDRLLARTYTAWKNRMNKILELNIVAEDFSQNGGSALVKSSWRQWRTVVQYRSAYATMRRRVDLRILDGALRSWRLQLHRYAAADTFYEQQMKRRMLRRWDRHVSEVKNLEKRADKHLAKLDSMLLYAVMRIWRAQRNGRLLEQARSQQLKAFALDRWNQVISYHRATEERANKFLRRPASSAVLTALGHWRKAYVKVKSQEDLANAFHMSHLAIVSVHQWRKRLRRKAKMAKAARAASKYFLMRRAWLQWIEQIEARRREQLLQLHVLNVKSRIFKSWLRKTHLARDRNQAMDAMQQKISKRILRGALAKWTNRVITLKSRELDIIQNCNMVSLVTAFQKWKSRHEQHIEAQNLLESFTYLQQKDHLRRLFYRWLSAARLSRHRKIVLRRKEDEVRLQVMEAVWDRWREKTLRSREDQVLLQRQRNILCRLFSTWHGKSKAPPAIRFDCVRVKKLFFKKWKGAMSHTHQMKQAMNLDRSFVAGRFFGRWVEVYKARKTLKAVARARHLRLPAAPARKHTISSGSSSLFPQRTDFLRPPRSSGRVEYDSESSDAASVASCDPPSGAPSVKSATSSTYFSPKSRAPSVMSSASRISLSRVRPQESSPVRTLQIPSSISRAHSSNPSQRLGRRSPSPIESVKSADVSPSRRAWPLLRSRARPLQSPK
ncbi:hypothetical protein NMY22_g12132 [Coprinellus aureogranulatus]|nr:hypothetical protein NMY22_g12132 [Coprinellus aureogranulatus]